MSITSWLRTSRLRSTSKRRLHLETLEDRLVPASIWYVDGAADGSNLGTSWINAFTSLQSALGAAHSGDQIWVAEGTYRPTSGTDRTISFALGNGVDVYGGFAGTETTLSQRNVGQNVTILSGDIGNQGDNSDNSYNVVSANISGSAVLDGFTITAGNAADGTTSQQQDGGGLSIAWGSLTLANLTFANNLASWGGGLANEGTATLTNVAFTDNTASEDGGALYNLSGNATLSNVTFTGNSAIDGGALDNYEGTATLTNVAFNSNSVENLGGGMENVGTATLSNVAFTSNSTSGSGDGGGLVSTGTATLTNVTFTGNSAGSGGGVYSYSVPGYILGTTNLTNVAFTSNSAGSGGGLTNFDGTVNLTNVTFGDNLGGSAGGGLFNDGDGTATLTDVSFTGNSADSGDGGGLYNSALGTATQTNVVFYGNRAGDQGGGVFNDGTATLTNTSFSGNSANPNYGFYSSDGLYNQGTTTIKNSILWGDSGGEIYDRPGSSGMIVSFSDVQGGYSGTGNINADPLYVDAAHGDLHLQAGSPAIDAGTNSGAPAVDLDGNPRPIDGNGDGTATTDMGAYERKADPLFSALSSPTIAYGTAYTTLTGHLAEGNSLVPDDELVSITINHTTKSAALDNHGDFTLAFPSWTLGVNSSPYVVTYSYAGDSTFSSASDSSTTLSVTKVTPNITWNNPDDITYGTSLSGTQLDASADVAGSFAYSPSAGTVLNAGTGQTLSAIFTPTDSTDYNSVNATSIINVTPATLTVTPAAAQSMVQGATVPTLSYSASGFVNGDNSSLVKGLLATTATSSSPGGTYPFTLGTLNAGGNYVLVLGSDSPTFLVAGLVYWINPAGGDWDDSANWGDAQGNPLGRLPGSSDSVVIDLPGQNNFTVTHANTAADSVYSIQSEAAISLSGGSLSIVAASTIDNSLTLASASLGGTGSLTVNGIFIWEAGTLSGGGSLTATAGMTLGYSTSFPLYLNGYKLVNPANETANLLSEVFLQPDGVFENDGTLNLGSSAGVISQTTVDGTFTNNGMIVETSGFSQFYAGQNNNYGTINVLGGSLQLGYGASTWLNAGTITAVTGTEVDILGKTFTQTTDATLNADAVVFSYGNFSYFDANVAGVYSANATSVEGYQSSVTFNGDVLGLGNLTVGYGETLDLSAATLASTAKTLSSLDLEGTLVASSDLAVAGSFIWLSGTLSNGGSTPYTLTGNMGMTLGYSTSFPMYLNGYTLVNPANETANLLSEVFLQPDGVFENDGTLNLGSSAGVVSQTTVDGIFTNNGMIVETSGFDQFYAGQNNNYGTIKVQGGILELGYGASTWLNAGTITAVTGTEVDILGKTFTQTTDATLNADAVVFSYGNFSYFDANVAGVYSANATSVEGYLSSVTFNGDVLGLGNLTVGYGETLSLSEATLANSAKTLSSLDLEGTLAASSDLTVAGSFTWLSGTLSNGGSTPYTLTGNMGMTLGYSTNYPLNLNGYTLVNPVNETANLQTYVYLQPGGVFENDGTLNLGSSAGVVSQTTVDGTFTNNGMIVETSGLSQFYAGQNNNYGTINVQNGTLVLGYRSSQWLNAGNITAATGTEVDIDGTSFRQTAAGTNMDLNGMAFTQPNDASLNADTVVFGYSNFGTFTVAGQYRACTTSVGGYGTKVIFSSDQPILGSLISNADYADVTFNPTTPETLSLSSLDLLGFDDALSGSDSFTVNELTADAGTTLAGSPGQTLEVTASMTLNAYGRFITLSGYKLVSDKAGTIVGPVIDMNSGAVFDNEGTLTVTGNTILGPYLSEPGSGEAILNNGSIEVNIQGGAGGLYVPGTFDSPGNIQIDQGDLYMGYQFPNTTLGGSLKVTNSSSTVYINGPTILTPTSSIFATNLVVEPGSQLLFQIAGSVPITGFDQINVNVGGTVALAGLFSLDLVNGFTPALGEPFTLINNQGSAAINGTFAGLPEGASITDNDGNQYSISYIGGDGNDVTLTTTALANTPPSNLSLTPSTASINEGGTLTLSGSFADPDAGQTHTVTINWGDGSASTTVDLAANVLTFSGVGHQYLDNPSGQPNGSFSITASVSDDLGATSPTASTCVQVNNVAPTLTSPAAQSAYPGIATTFTLGSFTDPGTLDNPWTVSVAWGDNSSTDSFTVSAPSALAWTHTYSAKGLYTVTETVTDKDGGKNQQTFVIVVGPIVTDTNDSGVGSLRQAINLVNTYGSGSDTITFDIPTTDPGYNSATGTFTIRPLSLLPAIQNPVVIDGFSQPGATPNDQINGGDAVLKIELNGTLLPKTGVGLGTYGLKITAGNSTVRGLVIDRFIDAFPSVGIWLSGAGGNVIQGDYLGTDVTGSSDFLASRPTTLSSNIMGYAVFLDSTTNNLIGTDGDGVNDAGERNVIDGSDFGVAASNNHGPVSGNVVAGNFIGTNAAGTAGLGNYTGIGTQGDTNDRIGTTGSGAHDADRANVISGNYYGILLGAQTTVTAPVSSVQVTGNFIGTDITGQLAMGNGTYGVGINGASLIQVGGTATGMGNVIAFSGAGAAGVYLLTNNGHLATGNMIQGNFIHDNPIGVLLSGAPNNTIGGTVAGARNVISGNSGDGVEITGAGSTNNVVEGNYIGTNAAGSAALANGTGVLILSTHNTIGGTTSATRNVISGNTSWGIDLESSGNLVAGNFVGTNAAGNAPLPNGSGILISASGNTIGGTIAGASNVISGNTDWGVDVSAGSNLIQGNLIGTDQSGTTAVPNEGFSAIALYSSGNTIGGLTATPGTGPGNVISGNGQRGIGIWNNNNLVEGNLIGLNASGHALGNQLAGMEIISCSGNTIGGTASGARNVISDNGWVSGILMDYGTSNTLVAGNYIGTDLSGSVAVGNLLDGIDVIGSSNNTIGGTVAAVHNVISGNLLNAITIEDAVNFFGYYGTATGNVVDGNYIGTTVSGSSSLPNNTGGGSAAILINASGNTIGGSSSVDPSTGKLSGAGNVISGNSAIGIDISGTGLTGNVVAGNYIGTNASGSGLLANSGGGITVNSSGNTIGGPTAGLGNVITGSSEYDAGVVITGSGAANNLVEGNSIGTNASGTGAIGNSSIGIYISSALNNTIGGTAVGARNIISGNALEGIYIEGAVSGATGNLIEGNYIGTNAAGTAALANTYDGIQLDYGSSANTIVGNVISGNGKNGILLDQSGTTGNVVAGNSIGTNAAGTAALANGANGVLISGAASNTVGGSTTGAGNLISGNSGDGVLITGSGANNNVVAGNYVGTDVTGTTALANGFYGGAGGVWITNGAQNNLIGGNGSSAWRGHGDAQRHQRQHLGWHPHLRLGHAWQCRGRQLYRHQRGRERRSRQRRLRCGHLLWRDQQSRRVERRRGGQRR